MTTTIDGLTKAALNTAVDYTFIKEVIGNRYKVGFIDYESFTAKTTLTNIFKKRDCLAILFHIKNPSTGQITAIGHWTLLIKPSKTNKKTYQFFDSLGLGLRKILIRTHEEPHLLNLLKKKGVKWSDSSKALQTQGSQFRECGAFVGFRGFMGDLTNNEFVALFKGKKADKLVVTITLLHYMTHEKVGYKQNDRKSKSKRR